MTTLTAPEQRLFSGFKIRELDTTDSLSAIEGLAVPYGRVTDVGWYLEEFAVGAFTKSIKEAARDLPFLLFHDNRAFPIGAAESWTEDADGLRGVWRLDGSDMAQRAAAQARDGLLTGLSVGFSPVRSEWIMAEDWHPDLAPENKDRVIRQEARLLEVSLVSTPAYVDAGVTLVRSRDAKQHNTDVRPALEAWKAELERLRG